MDGFRTRIERASTQLQASSPNFALSAPTVALAEAGTKAQIAGRRLLLVGGQAVVLLLAFVLLAATRLRSGARAAARRLESFGATGWQTRLAALAEAVVVVLPATLLGWLFGAGAAFVLAKSTDTPAGAIVSRSVFSWGAIALALLLAAGATLVFYLGSRARPVAIGGASISVADVAAVGRWWPCSSPSPRAGRTPIARLEQWNGSRPHAPARTDRPRRRRRDRSNPATAPPSRPNVRRHGARLH